MSRNENADEEGDVSEAKNFFAIGTMITVSSAQLRCSAVSQSKKCKYRQLLFVMQGMNEWNCFWFVILGLCLPG